MFCRYIQVEVKGLFEAVKSTISNVAHVTFFDIYNFLKLTGSVEKSWQRMKESRFTRSGCNNHQFDHNSLMGVYIKTTAEALSVEVTSILGTDAGPI